MKRKKVILDTNLWITFLISNRLESIVELLLQGKIELIYSKELLEEILVVVQRPKFRKYFSGEKKSILLKVFDRYGRLVNVISDLKMCRDQKDDFLLNLSVDSKADFLITGDTDLLVIEKIKKTKIVSWSDFIEEIN